MSKKFETIKSNKPKADGSLKSYIVGFVLSILLTILAFWIVMKHVDSGHVWGEHQNLTLVILVLALVQLVVQLVFFLHLSHEQKPRLKGMLFIFTGLIIVIVVAGSLWIMANLDYSHGGHEGMSAQELDKTIIEDEGIQQ